jgi:hypothetical protein
MNPPSALAMRSTRGGAKPGSKASEMERFISVSPARAAGPERLQHVTA